MKKLFLLLLLITAFTSCTRETLPNTDSETTAFAASLSQRPDGVVETNSKLIADYVMTDMGLVEYDYVAGAAAGLTPSQVQGILLAPTTDSSFKVVKATLDAANAARQSASASSSNELEPMATGTICTGLRDGCFYLVESNKACQFNAAWTRVYLPSRSKGEIRVDEDEYSACPNRKTSRVEVPYIFLGGHSKGITTQQNLDAGLVWQCGKDTWAMFMNGWTAFSGVEKIYASSYRMPAGQEVRMWFYVASISGGDLPRLVVQGNFVGSDGKVFNDSVITYTCASTSCKGGKWTRDGADQNFKMEVNIAQGEYRNGTFYKGRIPRSGAVFRNTQVRGLYLGNYLYNGSTKSYYWRTTAEWNVGANKSSSSLTEVQCVTPSSNYSITGNANSGTTGATINVNVLY